MTNEDQPKPGRFLVTSILPWLAGAGMLAVYLRTLNHGVTPLSLQRWGQLSGSDWRPLLLAPVTHLASYPLRWLSPQQLPLAMNLFAAACATLSLVLLARTVALLPHDRTHDQRLRETSESALLTIPTAWAPPVLAVLVCGLQMTFWEHAIAYTGEMFDLLLFAYVIRCLLEYRVRQRDSWLIRAALVFGLGMANNWAMIGFFPAFVAAVVWIKGLDFFNVRFLARMLVCGVAGLSLILLFPLTISSWHLPGFHFGNSLRLILTQEKQALFALPRQMFITLSLTSLLPVILIGIRWAPSFGDNSRLGIFLARGMSHVVHGLLFIACMWIALDAPASPRRLVADPAMPFLTFYYLGALSVGYFAGYFLLIFGTRIAKARQRTHPLLKALNFGVTALVWLLMAAVPAALVGKNLPAIQTQAAGLRALQTYNLRVAQSLPAHGVVLLSDNANRLYLFLATLNGKGNPPDCLPVDTASLGLREAGAYYFQILDRKYPQYALSRLMPDTGTNQWSDLDRIHLLERLSTNHDIYYLHPSFGYYSERFHAEPHGMVYRLQPYPTDVWVMPPCTAEEISENQAFWKTVATQDLPVLSEAAHPPERAADPNAWQRFLDFAHLVSEPDAIAAKTAEYYARSLDYWGVELERAGLKAEAGDCFREALTIAPENVSARVNQDYLRDRAAGKKTVIEPPKQMTDQFGKSRSWVEILNQDGPFAEPDFCYGLGEAFFRGSLYREAIAQFGLIRTLAPEHVAGSQLLAQAYIQTQRSPNDLSYCYPNNQALSNAVAALDEALRINPQDAGALGWKGAAEFQLGSFDASLDTAERILRVQPNSLGALALKGQALFRLGRFDAALEAAEQTLRLHPDDAGALALKGQSLVQQDSLEKALAVFDRLVTLQTNDYTARFNRGVVNLRLKHYDAAKPDYEAVLKVAPNSFQLYYGLGEIAYQQKDSPLAIKYFQAYLAVAPTNSEVARKEVETVNSRLKELDGGK